MTDVHAGWLIAIGTVPTLGVPVCIVNVLAYPIDMGNGAGENGADISQLQHPGWGSTCIMNWANWTRDRGLRLVALRACLGLPVVLIVVTLDYGLAFEKPEMPGIRWAPVEVPWSG